RTGIESMLGAGGYSRNAGAMGGVGVMANAAAALTIAALAVTTMQVGVAVIDTLFDKAQERQKKQVADEIATAQLGPEARAAAQSGDLEGAKNILEAQVRQREEQLVAREGDRVGIAEQMLVNAFGGLSKT